MHTHTQNSPSHCKGTLTGAQSGSVARTAEGGATQDNSTAPETSKRNALESPSMMRSRYWSLGEREKDALMQVR